MVKSPERFDPVIVYCSSAEFVLEHSAKAPSPEVQLLPLKLARALINSIISEF